MRWIGPTTSAALAGLAALHVAWGVGSSFPLDDRAQLADAVIGADEVPPPAACFAVAGALLAAGALTSDMPIAPARVRRLGRWGTAGVLAMRGALGLAASTDLISPGSTSPRFRQLDRRYYSPLCVLLALGVAASGRD